MALSYSFGGLTSWSASWLDTNFAELGACTTVPCTVSGTNALTLTPLADTAVPVAYANYQLWSGVAANDNTGAVTATAAALGVKTVYKDSATGPVALTGTEIQAGNFIVLSYDSALTGGAGGFHLVAGGLVGGAPTGAAAGDLTGTYPNPGVGQINGVALGSTAATAGNVLIGSGTTWVTKTISGDGTLADTGALAVTKTGGTSFSGLATATYVANTVWTPADGSGAGLGFSGVSAKYERHANIVFGYFTLAYPATADGTAAKLQGLPIAVPNQPYAAIPAAIAVSGGSLAMLLVPIPNTSTAKLVRADTGAAVTNANLSGLTISALLMYPVA